MPFINVKTNAALSGDKKLAIENKLSDAISLIPGKSDRYLMLAVEDNVSMMFHRDTDCAICCYVKFEECKLWGYNSFMF